MSKYSYKESELYPDILVAAPLTLGHPYDAEIPDTLVARYQKARAAFLAARAELMDHLEDYDSEDEE